MLALAPDFLGGLLNFQLLLASLAKCASQKCFNEHLTIGGNSEFSNLLKDTLTGRLKEPGINLPTF